MSKVVEIHVVRAFVNQDGEYGNQTGIVVDTEHAISPTDRQKIATQLHFTDTVFVNDLNMVNVSFFNPQQETKFAGDSLISAAYLIRNKLSKNADKIWCKGGEILTWSEGEVTWIRAGLVGTPGWQHEQKSSVVEVDSITDAEAAAYEHTMVWAWVDQKRGVIKSRTFLLDWGTLEDQGNGSGSMQLAMRLGRRIEIIQGKGSVIFAEPVDKISARVGGRVMIDEVRTVEI